MPSRTRGAGASFEKRKISADFEERLTWKAGDLVIYGPDGKLITLEKQMEMAANEADDRRGREDEGEA